MFQSFIVPFSNGLHNKETVQHESVIDDARQIGYGVVAPIIFTIGLAGNLATIVTLRNKKKFSGRLYTYLRALAISDVSCLIISVAMTVNRFGMV